MQEDIAEPFFLQVQFRDELVTAAQGGLELHVQPRDHGVCALLMKSRETDAMGKQELMTGMLDIVLVVGVVDNALKVTFIVAYLHLQFKDVISHGFIVKGVF